ncbi:MAG TPA: hypothetical protein VGK21_16600 [Candidatus Angelobacter sp.]|jgi:hypothetical protein
MQPQPDESAFDWIRCGRSELTKYKDEGWTGTFVSHLMPPIFDAYAKILHCIEADRENIDKPLTPREISILNIPPCEELKSFVESRRVKAPDSTTRIRWRELAEVLDVPFAPEICHEWYRKKLGAECWPRFLCGPADGVLSTEECRELVSVLQLFSDNECFFRLPEMPFIGTDKTLLFRGTLDELETFLDSGAYQFGPEYWWPPSRTWCVCSDYDLMFTVVGGSRKLISALLSSDVLECLEVTSQTRVDSFAPMV